MANVKRAVVVVRDGGKCENLRAPTVRERFRLRRDVVHARRGLAAWGLHWKKSTNPLTGIRRYTLDAGYVVADARDAGFMSYCCVEVDGVTVPPRHKQEEFAGYGGVQICILRATQHVLALLEARAAAAERALQEDQP